MNIPTAIKKLRQEVGAPGTVYDDELQEAQKLGIEALNVINGYRQCPEPYLYGRLPGETED